MDNYLVLPKKKKMEYFSENINQFKNTNRFKYNCALVDEFGIKYLTKVFPSAIIYTINGEIAVKIASIHLRPFLTFLKRHTVTNFNQLRDISAVDYPERKLRFEVVYQLLSITYNQRFTVSVSIPEGAALDSVTTIYPSSG